MFAGTSEQVRATVRWVGSKARSGGKPREPGLTKGICPSTGESIGVVHGGGDVGDHDGSDEGRRPPGCCLFGKRNVDSLHPDSSSGAAGDRETYERSRSCCVGKYVVILEQLAINLGHIFGDRWLRLFE